MEGGRNNRGVRENRGEEEEQRKRRKRSRKGRDISSSRGEVLKGGVMTSDEERVGSKRHGKRRERVRGKGWETREAKESKKESKLIKGK